MNNTYRNKKNKMRNREIRERVMALEYRQRRTKKTLKKKQNRHYSYLVT